MIMQAIGLTRSKDQRAHEVTLVFARLSGAYCEYASIPKMALTERKVAMLKK